MGLQLSPVVTGAGLGSSGTSAVGTPVVFRPGGVQAENVYDNWPDLYAAALAIQGIKSAQFDDSIAPCIMPSGTWEMENFYLDGAMSDTVSATLTLADGCVWASLPIAIDRLGVSSESELPVYTQTTAIFNITSLRFSSVFYNANSSGEPVFDCSGGTLFFSLNDAAGIFYGGSPVVRVSAGGTIVIFSYDQTEVDPETIIGAAGTVVFNISAGARVSTDQPSLSVVPTRNLKGIATQVTYTPTTSADWPGTDPTNVQEGLDQLASSVASPDPILPGYQEAVIDSTLGLLDATTGRAQFAVDTSGTYGYLAFETDTTPNSKIIVLRYAIDTNSQMFFYDGTTVSLTEATYAWTTESVGIVATSSYVYVASRVSGQIKIVRLAKDLTSPTELTISGSDPAVDFISGMGSDAELLFKTTAATAILRYTVTGLTAVRQTDRALGSGVAGVTDFNGTTFYNYDFATGNIRTYGSSGGSVTSTTRRQFASKSNDIGASGLILTDNCAIGIAPIGDYLLGVGMSVINEASTDGALLRFYKISKPA